MCVLESKRREKEIGGGGFGEGGGIEMGERREGKVRGKEKKNKRRIIQLICDFVSSTENFVIQIYAFCVVFLQLCKLEQLFLRPR